MADSTAALKYGVVALAFVGVLAAAYPFIANLRPSAKAKAVQQAIFLEMISGLSEGDVVFEKIEFSSKTQNADGSTSYRSGVARLSILDYDGKYYIYRLPTWNGAVLLPERYWGRWGPECNNFGPSLIEGKLVPGSTIKCRDIEQRNGWYGAYEWSLEGQSLIEEYPDLPKFLNLPRCLNTGVTKPKWC